MNLSGNLTALSGAARKQRKHHQKTHPPSAGIDFKVNLFVAQRIDRIELRRFVSRVIAEEHTDRHTEADR